MKNADKIKKLLRKAKSIDKKIKASNELREQLDDVILDLKRLGFKSGLGAVLVDNYRDKNVCFRTVAVKRYELKF